MNLKYNETEVVKALKEIPREKPAENYKPYHLDTYSHLEDVENYRFVADVIRLLKDTRARMVFSTNTITLKRNLAIFSLIYLSACRTSEMIGLTGNNIKVYKNEMSKYFVRINLKNLKNQNAKRKNIIFPYKFNKQEFKIFKLFLRYYIKRIKPWLAKYNITWKQWLIRSDKIDKDKMAKLEAELSQVYIFTEIKKNTKELNRPNDKPLSRQTINNMFNNYVKHNPHFFRKLRATHLYNIYGFRLKQLQRYLGHSNIKSSTPYTYIDIGGIENNFIEVDPK